MPLESRARTEAASGRVGGAPSAGIRFGTRVESSWLARHEAAVDFSAYLSVLNPRIDKHPFAFSRLASTFSPGRSRIARSLTRFAHSRPLCESGMAAHPSSAVFGRLVFPRSTSADGTFCVADGVS